MSIERCLYCHESRLEQVTRRVDEVSILRCAHCHLMMADQELDDKKPSPHAPLRTVSVSNAIGKYAFVRLVAEKVATHLDIGVADGSLMEVFRSKGSTTQGLEGVEDAVVSAQDKGLNVELSDFTVFPKTLSHRDIITAFSVLEFTTHPGAVIKNARDALASDGVFVFTVPCITKDSPTDYWFSNSLDTRTYYTAESLEFILQEIFGKDTYYFAPVTTNGVTRFWGIAKKTPVDARDRKKYEQYIAHPSANAANAEDAYWLSLFYNQIGFFAESAALIAKWSSRWTPRDHSEAQFYNHYLQGQFEKALDSVERSRAIPSSEPIFWHAVYDARTQLAELEKTTLKKESNEQIIALRDEVFKLRDELFALHNSKAVRYALVAKKGIGKARSLKAQPRDIPRYIARLGYRSIRKVAVHTVPKPIRKKVVDGPIKKLRNYLQKSRQVAPKQYVLVEAKQWPSQKPLVSVVIPYYNRASTIDDTLLSLQQQTFNNFEILIVDDGSTDPVSITKIEQLTRQAAYITVIKQKNQGVAAARNAGVARARGKYIVCLDSDDMIAPTYLEKAVLVLEVHPDISIVSAYMTMFGVKDDTAFHHTAYSPLGLYEDNMIITAAMFRKVAWEDAGGYTSNIGYEDWEFWLSCAEKGHFARQIPETLFRYRVAMNSRYVEDKDVHWRNLKTIRELHPNYKKTVKQFMCQHRETEAVVTSESALVNINDTYKSSPTSKKHILITMPWMVFGGAETLVYNYAKAIAGDYELSFMTGIQSKNEWEYKFAEVSKQIFHLPHLFEEKAQWQQYILTFIKSRKVNVIHLVHNEFMLEFLPAIRREFPHIKIVITMFNNSVEYFDKVIAAAPTVDAYVSDNGRVIDALHLSDAVSSITRVIPNGINAVERFNPDLFKREALRTELGLKKDELGVFFIGRLSSEKNPNVFLQVARRFSASKKYRFFMVGDGGMKADLQHDYKDVFKQDNFLYLGYQSDVAKYLAAADVFILPSSIEGFPLSVIEAMAMRVVPICSNVGSLPEIITEGQNGYIVAPGSAAEISQKLARLPASKALEGIKDTARETVLLHYTTTILGKNYKKLYKDLLQ